MLGRAAVAMWWDVAPGVRAEWEDWHTREHMPERLGIPGFLRGSRWVALSGEPSYFVLYEVTQLTTITGGAYLERLNNPTPWSRKMMPQHRNMVRSFCVHRAGWGGGLPQALATVRFSPRAAALPKLPRRNYDVDTVRAAAAKRRLPGAVVGLYRLAYSMTPRDLPR